MAAKVVRLKRREDFQHVAAAGQKWVTPGIVVQAFQRSAETNEIRLGFTVSGKVGNAVKRNRARRRLKALADQVIGETAQGGWDIVLIGRTATIDRAFDDLRQDLLKALKKLKVTAQ